MWYNQFARHPLNHNEKMLVPLGDILITGSKDQADAGIHFREIVKLQ